MATEDAAAGEGSSGGLTTAGEPIAVDAGPQYPVGGVDAGDAAIGAGALVVALAAVVAGVATARLRRQAAANGPRGPTYSQRTIVVVLAVALAASATVIVAAVAVAAPADDTCKNFYFVNARGSDQDYDRPSTLLHAPEGQAVRDGVDAAIVAGGREPGGENINLNYPAADVKPMIFAVAGFFAAPDSAMLGLAQRQVAAYLDSERQAEAGFAQAVNQIVAQCESVGRPARVVLSGYSQGAMAAHNYLVRLADQGREKERTAIVGAVLVADPERLPNSTIRDFSVAEPRGDDSYGVCEALGLFPVTGRPSCLPDYAPITAVPSQLRDRTSQLCADGDLVCDTGTVINQTLALDLATAGVRGYGIHTNCEAYCGDDADAAGREVGGKILARMGPVGGPPGGTPGGELTTGLTPGLSADEGPPGLMILAVAPERCPAPSNRVVAELRSSEGFVAASDSTYLSADGSQATVIALRGRLKTRFEPYNPPPSEWEQSPPGDYTVSISCRALDYETREEPTVKAFPDLPFVMTNPYTVDVSATRVRTTEGLRVRSNQPCPPGSALARARLAKAYDPAPSYEYTYSGDAEVAADGSWSAEFPEFPALPDGDYGLYATCITSDYFGSLAYGLSATITLDRSEPGGADVSVEDAAPVREPAPASEDPEDAAERTGSG
ncbi:cutinase family protein [Actinomycetospora aeridis]|uniref:Cutinase family protein n=1 Tax=Actinomycetospora aeridis TaxID=3129231 RepID=A0ABU8N8D9_9PSEU